MFMIKSLATFSLTLQLQIFSFSYCTECSGMNEICNDKGYSLQFFCLICCRSWIIKGEQSWPNSNFSLLGNFNIPFQVLQVIMKNENNNIPCKMEILMRFCSIKEKKSQVICFRNMFGAGRLLVL